MPPRPSLTGRCPLPPDSPRPGHDLADQMLHVLRSGGDLRNHKIRRIRQAIRTGNYENRLKLEVALDRMLGRMGKRV